MNNYFKRAFSVATLLGMLIFSSCTLNQMIKMAKQQELDVKPSPLQLHGDSVAFIMSSKLPTKMLKPNTTYSVQLSYKPANSDESLSLGSVPFAASEYSTNADPYVEKYFGFLYDDKYERGQVYIKGVATKGAKTKETPELNISEVNPEYKVKGLGVITTSRLLLPTFHSSYVPHGYEYKEEYDPTYADFYFLQGRSDLRYSEKRSDQAKVMEAYIAAKNPTRTVNMTGMHSPEGPTQINRKLANDRPAAVEKYYKEVAGKYDYKDELSEISFVAKPVVEDWTMFKSLLNSNTRLTDAQKNEVLSIIDGPGDFVSKELKLQTLSSYRIIFRDIYPPLRAAKFEILQIKPKKSEEEIAVLGKKIANGEVPADTLNDRELAFSASKTPLLDEKEKIYQAAIKKNDAADAYNNLGAVYLDMAKKATSESERNSMIDKAITQFELSLKKQETPEAFANLAGAKLMKGDEKGAAEAINKASGSSNQEVAVAVNSLKGYMAIRQGNYNAAIQALSSADNDPVVLYNKALAYLLKASKEMDAEGYKKAMAGFEEAIKADGNNAHAHYCAAITAARMDQASTAYSYLEKAVKANSALKERAVKDLEFFKFWDEAGFRNALN